MGKGEETAVWGQEGLREITFPLHQGRSKAAWQKFVRSRRFQHGAQRSTGICQPPQIPQEKGCPSGDLFCCAAALR